MIIHHHLFFFFLLQFKWPTAKLFLMHKIFIPFPKAIKLQVCKLRSFSGLLTSRTCEVSLVHSARLFLMSILAMPVTPLCPFL